MNPLQTRILLLSLLLPAASFASPDLSQIKVSQGYQIEVFAEVPNARSMARGKEGTLFVGTRRSEVYAVRNGKVTTLLKGLDNPNGVAFKEGDLYVAEISRLLKYPAIESHLNQAPAPVVLNTSLPKETHHGAKFIRFSPDGTLFSAIGAPCNVCVKDDPRFATIIEFQKDLTKDPQIFAQGVRNSVGFDWRPSDKTLWFTDNGRDNMGDDVPSDELNHAPKSGMNFGFPYCHEGVISDPEFGKKHACSEFTPPVRKLGAHVAALGMRFIDANHLLVAEHGSWNRSKKSGYRVMKLTLDKNAVTKEEVIVDFLKREKNAGRAVDIEILPDGSFLISDDDQDAIYRVSQQ